MCTSVSALVSQCVFGHGTLILGQALWIGLELEGSSIEVLNIYAPTDLQRKSYVLEDIGRHATSMDSWIVGGDFNNVELPSDVSFEGTLRISSIAP